MDRRNIYIVIFIASVIGLAFVQYQYLTIGLGLAKVQFNDKVELAIKDIKEGLRDENQLTYLMASAMSRDTSFFRTHPDSVIDASSHFLNDFLHEKVAMRGIEADFIYNLMSRDSVYYLYSPNKSKLIADANQISYPVLIEGYLPKVFNQRFVLNIKFKNLNQYFLSQLNGLILPSILFLLGIILTVIWALRTYYWQKKVITTTDDFINNLTHELKTPVFSIQLASKMLEGKVKEGGKDFVNIIRQQSERLSQYIEKVLELASMERKKPTFAKKKIDFKSYLLKLCEEFDALLSIEKEASFTYSLQEGEYWLLGEVFHLENMVNNLLDNAKKYSDLPKITLTAHKSENHLVIQVADNGIGIAENQKKRIFDKYYRNVNGDTHDVKGFGLGLSYVKNVVKSHKGKIELKSELGKGTIVTVKIPLVVNDG